MSTSQTSAGDSIASSSPIADLTYRNYDGPLAPPVTRWWPIAKMTMQLAVKKKWFWILAVLGTWYYIVVMIVLYFATTRIGPGSGLDPVKTLMGGSHWNDQFLHAFSYAQLLMLINALVIGSGIIASDNMANALLIYLSRPVTKIDYLFGKWLGIFLLISGTILGPALIFYAYLGMGFAKYGVFSQDYLLIFKLVIISAIAGAMHASLSVGISSLFKQPRVAMGSYAAVYFLSLFFTEMMGVLYMSDPDQRSEFLRNIFYCSIDGVQIGLAKLVLGSDGAAQFFMDVGQGGRYVPRPDFWCPVILFVGICGVCIAVAWNRIRPVEVVGR